MKKKTQIYRILAGAIHKPEEGKQPNKEVKWMYANEKVQKVEVKKYDDGEIVVDIIYED